MDLNGGNRKKLCDDYVVDLVTDGEYIYYENLNDEKEYRIKTDGTNRELLANIRGWNLNALGDSIYFSSEDGVYSVKKDGSRLKKLSSISQPYTLWLYQNKIYFFASSDGCIYAMNLDGSNFQKILNNCAHEFRISNGYIFFQRYDDKYMPYLFKANLDGTGVKKLSDYAFTTETFDLNKNNIFFTSSSKDHTDALYKMEFDGSNIKRLAELESTTIRVMGEWVYCYQPWGELYKVDIDGKTKVKMLQKYK